MDLNQTLYDEFKQVSDFGVTVQLQYAFWSTDFRLECDIFVYFRTVDCNSTWISSKLDMKNENKLVMSPIV